MRRSSRHTRRGTDLPPNGHSPSSPDETTSDFWACLQDFGLSPQTTKDAEGIRRVLKEVVGKSASTATTIFVTKRQLTAAVDRLLEAAVERQLSIDRKRLQGSEYTPNELEKLKQVESAVWKSPTLLQTFDRRGDRRTGTMTRSQLAAFVFGQHPSAESRKLLSEV